MHPHLPPMWRRPRASRPPSSIRTLKSQRRCEDLPFPAGKGNARARARPFGYSSNIVSQCLLSPPSSYRRSSCPSIFLRLVLSKYIGNRVSRTPFSKLALCSALGDKSAAVTIALLSALSGLLLRLHIIAAKPVCARPQTSVSLCLTQLGSSIPGTHLAKTAAVP
jgi:hypothetical protein